jgi:hypothetical protein
MCVAEAASEKNAKCKELDRSEGTTLETYHSLLVQLKYTSIDKFLVLNNPEEVSILVFVLFIIRIFELEDDPS